MIKRREDLIATQKIGTLSLQLPLLSNISLLENVDLISNYYHKKIVDSLEMFASFGIENCAAKREPNITNYERFITMLLRAVAFSSEILIIRPYAMLPEIRNFSQMADTIVVLDNFIEKITVLDFVSNQNRYEGFNEK